MTGRIIVCGDLDRKPGDPRPVHAAWDTRDLPRPWEEANDGRWMHVGHGDPFAATAAQITCRTCLMYVATDAETHPAPTSTGAGTTRDAQGRAGGEGAS